MKRIIFIALVIIIVTALFIIQIPERIERTMTVSTITGETANVDIDILYFSNLILPSYVKGKLTVDGIEYSDQYTMLKNYPGVSDNRLIPPDWWKTKETLPYNMTFLKSDCTDANSALLNRIDVLDIVLADGVYKVHYMYTDESNQISTTIKGISYWGPAKNAEEAKQIAASFGYQIP